jgi:hypothetical protein
VPTAAIGIPPKPLLPGPYSPAKPLLCSFLCVAAPLLFALCRAMERPPHTGVGATAPRGGRVEATTGPESLRTATPRPSASGSSAPSTIGTVRQPRTRTASSLTGNNVVTVPSSSPRAVATFHKGATHRCPGAATEHHVSNAESVDTKREMSSSTSGRPHLHHQRHPVATAAGGIATSPTSQMPSSS